MIDDLISIWGKENKPPLYEVMAVKYLQDRVYLVYHISPLKLLAYVESEEFKNNKVTTPHFQEQLINILNEADENDNEIIFCFRLKN